MKKQIHSYQEFIDGFSISELQKIADMKDEILEGAKTMTMEEADKILEGLNLPEHIREWLVFESRGSYEYTYKPNGNFRIVDIFTDFDTTLSESEEWTTLTENELADYEKLMWESIYNYVNSDSINEGFWSSLVSGIKKGAAKTVAVAKALVTGIGGFLKKLIGMAKQGLQKLTKALIGYGKSVASGIVANAKKKTDRLRQHSEEQIDKDTEDFGDTVAWVCGKGTLEGVKDGEAEAGDVAKAALGSDKEGHEEAIQKVQQAEQGAKKQAQQKPQAQKESLQIMNVLEGLSKDEFYEFAAASMIIDSSDGMISESVLLEKFEKSNLSEGFLSKVKSFFTKDRGKGKEDIEDYKKEKEAKIKLPGVADAEEELEKKDKEAEEKAAKKKPDISDIEDPSDKLEQKAKKAEQAIQKGKTTIGGVINKVIRILLQGPVYIIETIAESWVGKGLKAFSAWVKKLGGPGVFLMIAIAALVAILLGLALEVVGNLVDPGVFKTVVHFSSLGSGAHALEHALEHAGETFLHACAPLAKWIPVAFGVWMAVKHMNHILHDRKTGKNIDHSLAIEKDSKELEEDEKERKELEGKDDDKSKKLLELLDKKELLLKKGIKFHKDQRDRKIDLKKKEEALEEEMKKAKKLAKEKGAKKEFAALNDIDDKISKIEGRIDAMERKVKVLQGKADDELGVDDL